ncbi:MAG: hypothetical protein MH472_04685 [Bacteroidia bacterium]|nr:hypothetical protein [Bacteroidia bacterium]
MTNPAIIFNDDPILRKIVQEMPEPTFESTGDVFHDLVSCVVEQQIHYKSTKRIFARALERASITHLSIENFSAFEEFGLSQLKLSERKLQTLLLFVDYWNKNKLDFKTLTDDEVRHELSTINGIGNWTIDMILLYTLERPNIFPYDDFHLKQIMIELYQLNPASKLKQQMQEVAQSWANQSSLAVLYLLEHKKNRNKK